MKIKLILTGGTIGSIVEKESKLADVTKYSIYVLVKAYEEKYGQDIKIEAESAFQSLSENFNQHLWTKLCQNIQTINKKEYDGIIIAHGTDTLSYTSNLLSVLFAESEIPIVCIASNYPIGEKGSNGLDNFRSAVIFIRETKKQGLKGVYTIFQNKNYENILYGANQLQEADLHSDEFSSFRNEILGKIKMGKDKKKECIELYEENLNEYILFQKRCVLNYQTKEIVKNICFQNKVQMIHSYPGLDYSLLEEAYCNQKKEKRPKAILLVLYHSATACVQGNENSVLTIIKACQNKGIDFYMTSLKENAQTRYVTTQKMLDAGAIPLFEMSVELSYMKLWCAYNQNRIEAKEFMCS